MRIPRKLHDAVCVIEDCYHLLESAWHWGLGEEDCHRIYGVPKIKMA